MNDVKGDDAATNYKGAWGNRIGFGKKAAVLVIDFVKAYTLDGSPLFPSGVRPAVDETIGFLEDARSNKVMAIHIVVTVHHCEQKTSVPAWIIIHRAQKHRPWNRTARFPPLNGRQLPLASAQYDHRDARESEGAADYRGQRQALLVLEEEVTHGKNQGRRAQRDQRGDRYRNAAQRHEHADLRQDREQAAKHEQQ